MNIELVKQEIKTLSTLIDAWQEGKEVSAIERQVALNKLAKLYELIGLSNSVAETLFTTPIPVAANEQEADETEKDADEAEQEVEVEIIFADEDESEDNEEPEPEVEIEAEPAAESKEEVVPIIIEEPAIEEEHPFVQPAVETEPIAEVAAPIAQVAETIAETAPKKEHKEEKPRLAEYQPPMMESLFGADEIQRRPRSKHQRMMAIYEEAQPKQEKVVDISKIFDMGENDLLEVKVAEPTASTPATPAEPTITQERSTLADTITPTPTLADSIAAPAALAEEMTNSKINSLHQAIGINDKFLMIRDLFDGNGQEYDKAIAALDEQPSLEDCMIYIIENYQWNPDAEGSKFIMQLLERKFS